LKDAVPTDRERERGIIALGSSPPLHPSRGVFKEIPRRNDRN
jgi:hypothetical protein